MLLREVFNSVSTIEIVGILFGSIGEERQILIKNQFSIQLYNKKSLSISIILSIFVRFKN